eukprot:15467332-Alexandrium_andersonii.AAC.1
MMAPLLGQDSAQPLPWNLLARLNSLACQRRPSSLLPRGIPERCAVHCTLCALALVAVAFPSPCFASSSSLRR